MGYKRRRELIRQLQSIRGSKIVTHINSVRRHIGNLSIPGLVTQLSTEAQPFFSLVLKELGRQDILEIFLHTNGGNTDSVWPLVSLFREYSDNFNVLVPYKAHSAGTLICLGADKIIICKNGELSPVDPSTGNPFNPVDEINKNQRKVISVEDVSSYFDLARNPLRKNQDTIEESISDRLAFKELTENIHPLALGMVNRSHKQIRDLAQRLINTHSHFDESKISSVINSFTEDRYSHNDIYNRRELKALLGDEIIHFPKEEEEKLICELFNEYVDESEMLYPFCPAEELTDQQSKEISIIGGYIESDNMSIVYQTDFILTKRSDLPRNFQVQVSAEQPLPLIPGLPEVYHVNLKKVGWQIKQ